MFVFFYVGWSQGFEVLMTPGASCHSIGHLTLDQTRPDQTRHVSKPCLGSAFVQYQSAWGQLWCSTRVPVCVCVCVCVCGRPHINGRASVRYFCVCVLTLVIAFCV